MSQPELFPDASMAKKSPRLEWMQRHRIRTRFIPRYMFRPWQAWVHGEYEARLGATEDEALFFLAEHLRIRLWNEETISTEQNNSSKSGG